MEGNGPHNGKPKSMEALLLSTDPVALDAVACRLANLEPALVPTNVWGERLGLGTYNNITVLGDTVETLVREDFDANRKPYISADTVHPILSRLMKNYLVPRPIIRAERCIRCGNCVKMCPVTPKAVDFTDAEKKTIPRYNYRNCIRCYCCQEICPEGAIEVETPLLGRIIHS